jgi:hypothetical protein
MQTLAVGVDANRKTSSAVWPAVSIAILIVCAPYIPVAALSVAMGYLLALCMLVAFARRTPVPSQLLKTIACFGLLTAIGLGSGYSNAIYPMMKDAWYFLNPLVAILTGYVLASAAPRLVPAIRAAVIGATLLATFHIAYFLYSPELLTQPAAEIRLKAGNGHMMVGVVVGILTATFGQWRRALGLNRMLTAFALLLCTASLVLAFSRTLLIVFLITWIAMRGYLTNRKLLAALGAVAAMTAALFAIGTVAPPTTTSETQSFFGKLVRSATELKIDDNQDIRGVNENFRGYETARALRDYAEGGPVRWLVGRGFGHEVDLGLYLQLGNETPIRFIPVLHNGVVYVLVKTGAAGLLLFLGCFIALFRVGSSVEKSTADVHGVFAARFLQCAVVVSIVTAWLIAGPFNKTALFGVLLLMGFALHLCVSESAQRGRSVGHA